MSTQRIPVHVPSTPAPGQSPATPAYAVPQRHQLATKGLGRDCK